ncbi:hypothetical protein ABPG75_002577 [Micractinium tetrahymenae]
MALAARAGALALQQPAAAPPGAPQRLRPRHAPTVARAGRRDETGAGEPAGIPEGLLDLIPDPAADESLLAEDDTLSRWTDAYTASGSGSDYDWQAPGGGDPWFLSDYDTGLGGAGLAGGLTGQRGAGGAADVVAGQMGAAVGDPNFGFDQLKSEDWSDQLVNEVGEGNSFRREQRERYGVPLMNMTNLAHASEEELLVAAEAQALRDDMVDRVMDEAMALHHYFFENANNRYAIAARFGQLIEEIEYDDWNLPIEGEDQGVPSWCRAAFALRGEYDALNAQALLDDERRSEEEMAFFESQVNEHIERQLRWMELTERGASAREIEDEGKSALERAIEGVLPGTQDEFQAAGDSETLADDLLTRATKQADGEYYSVLAGALVDDEEEVAVAVESSEEEEEEGEEEELPAAAAGGKRRGPVLGAAHQSKVQAAAEDRERQKAGLLEMGQGSWSGRPSDPLLDLLDRHDQAS